MLSPRDWSPATLLGSFSIGEEVEPCLSARRRWPKTRCLVRQGAYLRRVVTGRAQRRRP